MLKSRSTEFILNLQARSRSKWAKEHVKIYKKTKASKKDRLWFYLRTEYRRESNAQKKPTVFQKWKWWRDFPKIFLLRETSREQKELGILTNLYISLPSAPCFPISASPCKHFDVPRKIAYSTCSLASLEVNGRQYFPTNEDGELHHSPRLECLFLCYLHVVFPKLQSLFDQRCQANKRNRSTYGRGSCMLPSYVLHPS